MTQDNYNRSAEVVFATSHAEQETDCLEKCFRRLSPRERELLLCVEPWRGVTTTRELSTVQIKKSAAKLKKCMQNCLEEEQDKAL